MSDIEIFSFKFTLGQFIAIMGIAVTVVVFVIETIRRIALKIINNRRRVKDFYRIIWKKSQKLKPGDIFGNDIYRFNDDIPYYLRDIDSAIKEKINNGQDILIVGKPLAGKTRAILQNLKESKKYVLVPKSGAKLDEIIIPKLSCPKRQKIIVLDNIQNFLERDRPEKKESALEEFIFNLKKMNIQIIASCRSGFELDLLEHKIDTHSIIKDEKNIVNILELDKDEVKNIVNQEWKQSSLTEFFDGTIGSLIMPLKVMRDRFNNAITPEKNILVALKMLYITSIYDENGLFLTNRIKLLCSTENLSVPKEDFQKLLDSLEKKEFIKIESYKEISAKDVYLEKIVAMKYKSILDLFLDIINIFQEDAEALFRCGSKACSLSLVTKKREYLEISIKAYLYALKINTLKKSPLNYATTLNNLGNSYNKFADVKDPEFYSNKAIEVFEEALKITTLEDYPLEYAQTQTNLGNSYSALADVKDKEINCLKAIEAYEKALKIFSPEDHPLNYATTKNNLGIIYVTLAEIEDIEVKDKENNCLKAIEIYGEVLKIRTLEDHPLDYAMTKNNLGIAYQTLAYIKDKEINCLKAIEVFEEALKIRTLEDYPLDYAMTLVNIGNAYKTLTEVEDREIKDKGDNIIKSIEVYDKALKIYTQKEYPLFYAKIKRNLGIAYEVLSEIKDKETNLLMAIDCYKVALIVFIEKDYPLQYKELKQLIKGIEEKV